MLKEKVLFLVGLLLLFSSAYAEDWNKRVAGDDWTWFEDYGYLTATYVVACEPGRLCQVGMGIFAFGEPRGEKVRFSEYQDVTVVGIGALHIRSADGKGPVKAAVIQKSARVPTLIWTFP